MSRNSILDRKHDKRKNVRNLPSTVNRLRSAAMMPRDDANLLHFRLTFLPRSNRSMCRHIRADLVEIAIPDACFLSYVDPHLSSYCLAVTSGSQLHPSTLCAAQKVLKAQPHSARAGSSTREHHHRGIPEGLHCVRQTKLTLHKMKYDTTYNFTLYVVGLPPSINRIET